MNKRLFCILALSMMLGVVPARSARADTDALQQAIAQAPAGATLQVPAGVHHGSFILKKPITLVGQPGAILDADGAGDVIRVQASGVTVRNLTLRHSGFDLTAMNAGVYIERGLSHVTIDHNQIEDILFGVYLDGPQQTVVSNNRIAGATELDVPDRGDGIHLWSDAHCTISNNHVSGTRDGIYDYVSHDDLIEGNTIDHVRYGVHQMYSKRETIRGNISNDNVGGMALMSSDHLHVIDNHLIDDRSYGILFNYVTYSDIQGNEVRGILGETGGGSSDIIDGGEGKALFLYNSEYNTIRANLMADSTIGIHITAGAQDNTVYENCFLDNRTQVKYAQNVAEEWSLDKTGNYWSNYLGWDMNGDQRGDVPHQPNDGIDILLWKYPDARSLIDSPAILLLRYVQRAFPVFTPPNIRDSYPLMRPSARWRTYVQARHH
ncbi:nitrous oxide reductase family maturation protein NosD [Castellaniella caeni]